MFSSTSYFNDLIWYSCEIVRCSLIAKVSQSKLTLISSSTHEEPADVINKPRMKWSSTNLFDMWLVVLIEVHSYRSVVNSLACTSSALTKLIVSPSKSISFSCNCNCMWISTWNGNRSMVEKSVNQNWRCFHLNCWLIDTKLTHCIAAHSVTEIWCSDKSGMF